MEIPFFSGFRETKIFSVVFLFTILKSLRESLYFWAEKKVV